MDATGTEHGRCALANAAWTEMGGKRLLQEVGWMGKREGSEALGGQILTERSGKEA